MLKARKKTQLGVKINVNKQQQKNLIHFCEGELCSCASYKNGKKGKSEKKFEFKAIKWPRFCLRRKNFSKCLPGR